MHTPGPWTAHKEQHGLFVSASSFCIARFGDGHGTVQNDNAKLIAAAPDLLAALKSLILWQAETKFACPRFMLDHANAAIAKAES